MKDDKSIIGKIKALIDSDANIFFTSFTNIIISLMVIAIFLFAANWLRSYYNANNVFADYIVCLLVQWYTLMLFTVVMLTVSVITCAIGTKNEYGHIIFKLENAGYHMISYAVGIGIAAVAIILAGRYDSLPIWAFSITGSILILYTSGWPFYLNLAQTLTYIGKRTYRKVRRDLANNKKIGSVTEAP